MKGIQLMKRALQPLTVLALVGLCSLASADAIRLKNGTRIEGHATAYDGRLEILTWEETGGENHELKLEQLDQRSAYRVLKSQVPKDSGKGQLQLANFARDIEYFAHAVRHYGYAEKADPSLKGEVEAQLAILRSQAAKWGMQRARECGEKGDIKGAEKWLEKIITKLPDEPEAAEAKGIIDRYYAKVHAEATARVEAEAPELLRKELAGAKKAYEKMLEKNQKALKDSKGGSKSVKGWEGAVKDGEKSLHELDQFSKKNPDNSPDLIAEYRGAVVEHMSEIYLHLANHWATRTSYNKALVQVNHVLAMDPENTEALSMRNRIQDAASRGIRWFW